MPCWRAVACSSAASRTRRHRARRGIALVTVLGVLALAAALIAGAFATAMTASRATRTARAALVARESARRALGRAVAGWQAADDSLPIGAFTLRTSPETSVVRLDSTNTRLRIQRLSLTRFIVAADVTVPAVGPTLARRRMRVLLERPPSPDSTTLLAPRPIGQWPVAELY
jgi:type II secretory pathway component PulK